MNNKFIIVLCMTVCVALILRLIRQIISDINQYRTRKRVTDLAQIAVCFYYLLNSDDGRGLIMNIMNEAKNIIDGKEEK